MTETKYECQGIGKGATCGAAATEIITSVRIAPDGTLTEGADVWVCLKHKEELDSLEDMILDRLERGER